MAWFPNTTERFREIRIKKGKNNELKNTVYFIQT